MCVGVQRNAGLELEVLGVGTESVDVTDAEVVDGAKVDPRGLGPSAEAELYDEVTEGLRAWTVAPGLVNPNGTGLGTMDRVELGAVRA
jgi:hypothetical protein